MTAHDKYHLGEMPDPRRWEWSHVKNKHLMRGLIVGTEMKRRRDKLKRNWTLLSGLPVIQKTVVSMSAEYQPIIEHVKIGSVTMIFSGTQFVGFEKDGRNVIIETDKPVAVIGDEVEKTSSMSELVKRFYLALGTETTTKVNQWIDEDLTGQRVFKRE